ncbi:N-alpha-acetyltransferase 80 [Leuresthes tenuis]|uniref:N-alpha-acetyltransferase 80 n=1 Tax=Leuresthes tenuis TaxID=355514 RepID=UPI003B5039B7
MKTDLNPDHHRSEPIISSNPKLDSGDELNVDPHPVPPPRCRTKHEENLSTLDGEAEEKPHVDSEQPERIRAVPIHQRPDLLVPCADLVNSEWQRSQAARVHSLQKSCSEFPVCLVLLQGHRGTERLLGHARLSRVTGHSSSLFVESVVVSKEERGRGYGRTLMEETERYAKRRGFKRLCLTTHDKQHFYAHLGYVLSTPVQSTGAVMAFVPMEMLMRLSRFPNEEASTRKQTLTQTEAQVSQDNRDSGGASVVGSSFSLPPPPPPPPSISTPPPPPPPSISTPPPPPPSIPPPQSAEQLVVQTLTETPYRDAKGVSIFWMNKDI